MHEKRADCLLRPLLRFSEFLLSSDCAAVAEKVDACEITVAFVGKEGNRKAELLGGSHSLLAGSSEHASAVLHLKCEISHLKEEGMFMTEKEAKRLMLTGATLLTGRK